jgi:DNA-nicking Smr family endonuclease
VGKKKRRDEPFNNPFAELAEELRKKVAPPPAPKKVVVPPPPPKKEESSDREEDLFARAMAGAKPLRGSDPRGIIEPELPPGDAEHVPHYDEDAAVYEHLLDLVEGRATFDISDSDEFIEGCVEGLDRRILQGLKRGDYAFRAHLDLHGMLRDQARDAVDQFISKARREKQRCVLIVHGRGKNSKDNIPVLKGLLKSWLERGRIAKSVLAFCTARPHDGGAGAMYVLLRR